MSRRPAVLLVAALAALLGAGGALWWRQNVSASSRETPLAEDGPLPLPPAPPRIAEGDDYERCLAMLPNDPAGAAAMAEAWLPAGGGEAATHCLALSKLAFGEAETGARMLETLAAASKAPPAQRAQVFDQAGQAWMMAGNPARALEAQNQAIALSLDDADLLVDRAGTEAALEQHAAAVRDLSAALDLDPSRNDARVQRASAWRKLGRLDLAEEDVDRALDRDPDDAEALLERGILRERTDDQAGARSDWQRAITLQPDSDTADLAQQNLALLDAGPERR
jgi:tetratricopeptide (TPR) repeat protein